VESYLLARETLFALHEQKALPNRSDRRSNTVSPKSIALWSTGKQTLVRPTTSKNPI